MNERPFARCFRTIPQRFACVVIALVLVSGVAVRAETPAVSAKAPEFTLSTPTGKPVSLASETAKGELVLVVLRGFPGYQCPYCVKQVHDFAEHSSEFLAKNVRVLFVYPGPPAELDQRAKEFLEKQSEMPANMQLVVDPEYKVTNLYGLRWDAPHETAYPATFLLSANRTVLFEKVSHGHGDRTLAEEILAQVPTK